MKALVNLGYVKAASFCWPKRKFGDTYNLKSSGIRAKSQFKARFSSDTMREHEAAIVEIQSFGRESQESTTLDS